MPAMCTGPRTRWMPRDVWRSRPRATGASPSAASNATTGCLTSIPAGSSNAMQSLSRTYDLLGNPLSCSDANTKLSERFTHDAPSRLISTALNLISASPAKNFSYSALGKMLSKSDVGNCSYARRRARCDDQERSEQGLPVYQDRSGRCVGRKARRFRGGKSRLSGAASSWSRAAVRSICCFIPAIDAFCGVTARKTKRGSSHASGRIMPSCIRKSIWSEKL